MAQTQTNCLPVYLLIDTSGSMERYEDVLNESLEELYDTLISSPRVSEFVHVSILSFNTRAEVVLGIRDLHKVTELPVVECGGATNLAAGLRLTKSQIDSDIPSLRAAGYEVLRPVTFLLTDGLPTNEQGYLADDWKSDFDELIDPSWSRHPNVVPFGYGAAPEAFLRSVSTIKGAAFLAKRGETSDALAKVIPALLHTFMASARANELRLPADLEGFINVSKEVVD
jgi:uncharacterized protein YegL